MVTRRIFLGDTLAVSALAATAGGGAKGGGGAAAPVRRDMAKVGRNDPCPCGSGKKYKKCCGAGL